MPPKRKRTPLVQENTVCKDKRLSSGHAPWGWVGSEVKCAEDITLEHRQSTCNLSQKNNNPLCVNKYSRPSKPKSISASLLSTVNGELRDDIIFISDSDGDEEPTCSTKTCRVNPFCLNYLGQDKWEEDTIKDMVAKHKLLERDPNTLSRELKLPVGLKNLGATCYANASLQVWYRDLAFRAGVFSCVPPDEVSEAKYKDSPIFQLQVTFSALQEGNTSSFNPEKLVESLQLRTTEQQDAQEFSKLFMSHLDMEFKKQTSPAVKSLIKDQFQGSQVYGTTCHTCNNRSERSSDFLEIELSMEKNSTLEDRLAASLAPETLTGDNKYFCSCCESLQEATRYTELRQLPPVLHLSLLRFVYDISTMERKKSKHSMTFPLTLNMKKFIGPMTNRGTDETQCSEDELYELRGILLHKGASAYHGHYEAQVYDVEYGAWFQFNDETVTQIKTLGDKVPPRKPAVKEITEIFDDDDQQPDSSEVRQNRANARKKRRIDDSDDEVVEIPKANKHTPATIPQKSSEKPNNMMTSKDAYMLIYARKSQHKSIKNANKITPPGRATSLEISHPPPRAREIVLNMNKAHEDACQAFLERSKEIEGKLERLRSKVKEVYSTWSSRNTDQESIVVSRQALEEWLSHSCIMAGLRDSNPITSNAGLIQSGSSPNTTPLVIPSSEIICEHGRLDPLKARDMKCLSQDSFSQILGTGCTFGPILKMSDPCDVCIASMFREKLYECEHLMYTKSFDGLCTCEESEVGYWISKRWCKDWKLVKPRMHVFAQDDPAPDSQDFYSDVFCEHGELTLQTTGRRKINFEAVRLLQRLFPDWNPPSTNAEMCPICDAEVHISKADKKEIRRRAEDEKARLRFISQSSLDSWTDDSDMDHYAVLPTQFVRDWKRWVNSPFDNPRPEGVNNNQFICQHGLLLFDPNCPSDLDSVITVVKMSEWDIIQSIYTASPLLELTRRPRQDEREYDHSIAVCDDCRTRSKREWESADIFIRLGGPTSKNSESDILQDKPIRTYSRVNGARQSRRLQKMKEHGERRKITISKATTVKDIKIMASKEFNVPTICQRLFYQGHELQDNQATAESLQILVNDIIDMKEVNEILEIDSDSDDKQVKKQKRIEEAGFGGTLLGSTDSPWSSSSEQTPLPAVTKPHKKACFACTYINQPDYLRCEICNTILV